MEKDTEKTKVIFRYIGREVVALFPDEKNERNGLIMSYMHIGQHGEASTEWIKDGRKVSEKKYADLYKELESIGYNLEVVI